MRFDSNVKTIFNEALDMTNDKTFLTMVSLNEAEQKNAIIILASKLYKMITNKLEDTDYREIELSKGDVKRMKQYKQTIECIDVLFDIAQESGTGIEEVATIKKAMDNVEMLKPIFTSGFKENIDLIKYFYDTIVLGIITDIGFMTTVCVEFIKNPNSTVSLEITNLQTYKTKFYMVHTELEKFNAAVEKGQIEKAFKALIVNKAKGIKYEAADIDPFIENKFIDTLRGIRGRTLNTFGNARRELRNVSFGKKTGDAIGDIGRGTGDAIGSIGRGIGRGIGGIAGGVAAGAIVAGILTVSAIAGVFVLVVAVILPILRDLAYLFFAFRTRISDWFSLQHDLLEANSVRLKSLKNDNGHNYKEASKAQEKWAARMQAISDKIAVNYVPAEKSAIKQIKKDSKVTLTKKEIDQPNTDILTPTDTEPDYDDGQPSLF